MKKSLTFLLALSLLLSLFPVTAGVISDRTAVIAGGDITFEGSSFVNGDMLVADGTVTGRENEWLSGILYRTEDVLLNSSGFRTELYDGSVEIYVIDRYAPAPSNAFFASNEFSDGGKDLIIDDWVDQDSERTDGYMLNENAYLNNLIVRDNLTLNIHADSGTIRVIRASTVNTKGKFNIIGGGTVLIYTDRLETGSNSLVNASHDSFGDSDSLYIVINNSNVRIDNFKKISAHIISLSDDLCINNGNLQGNIYTPGNVKMTNSGAVTGLVFAPNSATELYNSTKINGKLITASLKMSGSTEINYASTQEISGTMRDVLVNGPQAGTPSGGGTGDDGAGDDGTGDDDTGDDDTGDDDTEEDSETGKTITIPTVIPRRMSVRLEDGTVLKNGDTFQMKIGQTIRFQMCTNNWDVDRYADGGIGLAGTKVYEFTCVNRFSVLRVDTNKYFMAIRFYYTKGNYNKQTGIANVLSVPLESLSINLPLGSTITCDSYLGYQYNDSANVFVETAADKTISYTDFYWNY